MIDPIEIENKEFKKSLRGYNEDEVDEFLDLVKEDYEQLYRENIELKEKIKLYQDQKDDYKDLKGSLDKTLQLAKDAVDDITDAANNNSKSKAIKAEVESERIISEAKIEAKKIISEANNDKLEITREYNLLVKEFKVFRNKFISLLNSELTSIDELFSEIDEEHSGLDNTRTYNIQSEVAASSLD